MRKWQRVALTAALTAATAGGVAAAGFAAILNDTGTYKAPWIP